MAACAGLAWLLGYGGSRPAPGFGTYAMNLLNPVLPQGSSHVPQFHLRQARAAADGRATSISAPAFWASPGWA